MSCCCCCCQEEAVSEASVETLKRELRSRYNERIDDFASAFFDELRRDLHEGRVDDALLLMDRVQWPGHRTFVLGVIAGFA